mgnify:CR=1 FL=1
MKLFLLHDDEEYLYPHKYSICSYRSMLASNNLHFPSSQLDNHMEHRLVCIRHHGSRSNRHRLSLLVHNVPLQTLRDRCNCNFLLVQSHCKFHSGTKSCWSHHTWSEVCHRSTHWCWKNDAKSIQSINLSSSLMSSHTLSQTTHHLHTIHIDLMYVCVVQTFKLVSKGRI